MKISKKKHLEMILENIPSHPNPKVGLEQYSTPSSIAADLIWNAYSLGDIKDLSVLDLGCGTGIFAIASLIMQSRYSLGIDIDNESIELADKTKIDLIGQYQLSHIDGVNSNFIVGDINQYNSIGDLLNDNVYSTYINNPISNLLNDIKLNNTTKYSIKQDLENNSIKFDTIIQNPPFGSQERGSRHADRKFMEFAAVSADVIYSFHMRSSEEFVIDYFRGLGAEPSHKFTYKFKIPKIYDFHTKESQDVDVIVLRLENFD